MSVFGAFDSRALVEMSLDAARELFGSDLSASSPSEAVASVERDIAAIRGRDARLADSGLAAAALSMAYELENPFNSATSKAMCAKALLDTLNRLRELCPPERKADAVDAIRAARRARQSGAAAVERPAGTDKRR